MVDLLLFVCLFFPRDVSQPHLDPWEADGVANLENHFQAYKGRENYQKHGFTMGSHASPA